MRKITSKYQERKKQKRNTLVVGIILIFVMFASVFGIVVNSFGKDKETDSIIEYNGYEFLNENDLWYTSIGNFDFVFKYNPDQTKDIETELHYLNNYQNKPLYIYSEDYDSKIEIYRNLDQIVERMQPACFSDEKCEGDYPTKTCFDNFIIIEVGNESEIIQNESCVYIRGAEEELLGLTDEFLFNIIGIK